MPQEQSNEPDPQQPDDSAPRPKPRKRRRWLKVILVLLLLLIGLIALGPTIASTGPVRSLIVGKVNDNLNGRAEIGDWSLGWFSPISVSGVKVYDDEKRLILDVPRIKLGVSLLGAARQNFALGDDNVIEVDSFVVRLDEAGKTNLEKLPRPRPTRAPTPPSAEPLKLPNISGKFTVNFRGTIEAPAAPAVHVDPSTAIVTISDINQPIANSIKLAYHVGDGEKSTIDVSGTVDVIDNNAPAVDKLAAAQKVELKNVNLAAAEPFLKKLGQDVRCAGMANGAIDVDAKGLTGISAAGEIVVANLLFGGGPLKGDQFKTDKLSIPLNITRTVIDGNTTQIRIERAGVQMSQANVSVTGQTTEQALLNLIDRKAPGSDGSLSISLAVTDLKDLANQLRNTLQLEKNVQITGGAIKADANFALAKDRITIAKKLNAFAEGTRDGKTIKLTPIDVTVDAVALPTGKEIPDLRDIKLAVTSAFATVTGGGASLAKVDIKGDFDLGRLRNEIGQFADLGQIQLQGNGSFAVNTDGDLTSENAPVKLGASASLQNVKISGIADQRIDQDKLKIDAGGILTRARNAPQKLEKAYVMIVSGDPQSPLVDVEASAEVDVVNSTVPWFGLKKLNVADLKAVQDQYGGLVPALAEQKIKIESGAVYATTEGSFDGSTLKLTKPFGLSLASLGVSKDGRRILNREIIRASLNGDVSIKDGIAANLTDLNVTSESKLFGLAKAGEGPLKFTMAQSGAFQGNGAMALSADLKRLSDIAQAFGGQIAVSTDQARVNSGQFNGTVALAKGDKPQTDLKFDGQITALWIASGQSTLIDNEQLTISLNATAPDDTKANPITASGKIGSSFVNATLGNVSVTPGGAALEMLNSANIEAQVPEIPKLVALVNAFAPVLGDLQITSGGAMLRMNVARDNGSSTTRLDITDLRISRLALRRGERTFPFDRNTPISLKLSAAAKNAGDKIERIEVTALSGDVRIASLEMPEKIVITNPQGEQPAYQGKIRLLGAIEQATPLLAVLQNADPMPYRGRYELTEQITTRDAKATLAGAIEVTDFQVLNDNNQPAFTEPKVAIVNDLDLDLAAQKAAVRKLTVDMPASQALAMSFTGGLNFWNDRREMRPNTQLDLTYDLEKLWTIVKPMLSPEQQQSYKDLKVAGKYQRSFKLAGAFPAAPTWNESIKSLRADGAVAVQLFDSMGLHVENFELPVTLNRGVVRISDAQGKPPKPASANSGTLDLGLIQADLGTPGLPVTIPPKKVILNKVALNPVLADSLGKTGALVLLGATEAEGELTFTSVRCDRVPLASLMEKKQDARAEFVVQIDKLHLNGIIPSLVAQAADMGSRGFEGRVPPSTITLANGEAQTDLTVEIDREFRDERTGRNVMRALPMKFVGGLRLADLNLRNYTVSIPPELMIRDLRRVFPNGAVIALKGNAAKPQLDLEKAIRENAVKGILGGGDGEGQNPVGDLLDKITGGSKDKQSQDQPPPRRQR